jgi:hypothetical protein
MHCIPYVQNLSRWQNTLLATLLVCFIMQLCIEDSESAQECNAHAELTVSQVHSATTEFECQANLVPLFSAALS